MWFACRCTCACCQHHPKASAAQLLPGRTCVSRSSASPRILYSSAPSCPCDPLCQSPPPLVEATPSHIHAECLQPPAQNAHRAEQCMWHMQSTPVAQQPKVLVGSTSGHLSQSRCCRQTGRPELSTRQIVYSIAKPCRASLCQINSHLPTQHPACAHALYVVMQGQVESHVTIWILGTVQGIVQTEQQLCWLSRLACCLCVML